MTGPFPYERCSCSALIREARQLGQYGVAVSEPVLDYARLLVRVREVVHDVRAHSSWREQIRGVGVSVHEHAGIARFVDPHTIETATRLRLRAEKFILCIGGVSRRLNVPGFEVTNTHSDAWSLTSVPESILVIGGGATRGAGGFGVQCVWLARAAFPRGPRILPTDNEDIRRPSPSRFAAWGL